MSKIDILFIIGARTLHRVVAKRLAPLINRLIYKNKKQEHYTYQN
jgi:hypothetical protein